MHRYLRLGALSCAAVIADRTLEESSLLQEASKPVKSSKRDTKPLAGLLESARGFLTNGATPDVVTFANETLIAVAEEIIPKLLDESRADKNWMRRELNRFTEALTDLGTENGEISTITVEEEQFRVQHRECRSSAVVDQIDEELTCYEKRQCEKDLHSAWKEWESAELKLRLVEEDFEKHFCPQCPDHDKDDEGQCPPDHPGAVNGTLNRFRGHAYTKMEAWTLHKAECDTAEQLYQAKVPICSEKNSALDTQSIECNSQLRKLEGKACSHGSKVSTALHTFHSSWSSLHRSYQGITDLIYNQTEDRMKEYKTLVVVQCLLERVNELNGRPCDENSGSAEANMNTCELQGSSLVVCTDQPDLCQDYLAPPATPDVCNDPTSPTNVPCLPVPQLMPCDPSWDSHVYPPPQLLTSFPPNPPFSEMNPGCNDYPDCDVCGDNDEGVLSRDRLTKLFPLEQEWVEPPESFLLNHATYDHEATAYAAENSLWGATVDGCSSSNHNSRNWEGDQSGLKIPLTVRGVEDTAAVRCCNYEGTDCTSEIGGSCWNAATFRGAEAICKNDGKRLCTQLEMDGGVCCSSGCWFDHFAVWIADGTPEATP